VSPPTNAPAPSGTAADPADQVTALYQAHAILLYRHGTVTAIKRPGADSLLLANETAF
jgi:hypothetical protein